MTCSQDDPLAEARSSLAAAKVLRREGYAGFAASRAYFAMFRAAEALLLKKGMAFSKHAGVVAAFGRHFVKAGEAAAEYHRYLIEGMELRHVGDYGRNEEVSPEQCDRQIAHAEEFLALAQALLGAPEA